MSKQHPDATEEQLENVLGIGVIDAYSCHRAERFRERWCSLADDAQPPIGGALLMGLEFVPARCTGLYQVADRGLNKSFKAKCAQLYMQFCTKQVTTQLDAGVAPERTQLKQSTADVAPHTVAWAFVALEHMRATVKLQKCTETLQYSRCWSDAALRREGIRLLMGAGEDVPEEDVEEDAMAGAVIRVEDGDDADVQDEFTEDA